MSGANEARARRLVYLRHIRKAKRRDVAIMLLWAAFDYIDDAASRDMVRFVLGRIADQADAARQHCQCDAEPIGK
ncbi:hypothetical protein LG047_15735 [Methylocystis sp. WRRC1]|uniref:hypothetical protein n=1 Tax=Methylocystis sp. WRRC1 TaxID=1732014 RepID=UPI001D153B2F|nr:hypothetical protein [Methylocystis sp. WRRC1]MCC3246750.1 hypothetical protein [Methylocystis sp. WRRC1]